MSFTLNECVLTAGAVQPPPARLTLAGIRWDAASVGTFLSAQRWEERRETKMRTKLFFLDTPEVLQLRTVTKNKYFGATFMSKLWKNCFLQHFSYNISNSSRPEGGSTWTYKRFSHWQKYFISVCQHEEWSLEEETLYFRQIIVN